MEDLSTIILVLNEERRGFHEFIPFTEDRLVSWLEEGRLKILVAEEDGDLVGSAAYNDGNWGEEIEWLVVPQTNNRQVIEDLLVTEVEKCVKDKRVFTVVDAGNPKTDRWAKWDYKPEGGLYQMTADLDGVNPLPKTPQGFTLRSLDQGEEKEFIEMVNAGFGWERLKPGSVQQWRLESSDFKEDWIHVAEFEDKIVSAVVAKRDVDYNRYFGARRGYLGPATTLPDHRHKNLASALTCRAMNFLFNKRMNSVALYTSEQNVASITLLQGIGFKINHRWKFMRKDLSQPAYQTNLRKPETDRRT
jgi:ribosomal protein S18 acetylase RimI-like enzyme